MKHQATGSLTISTDAIAEAVVEALRPLLADRSDPAPTETLSTEQALDVMTGAVGTLNVTSPASDRQLAQHLLNALRAAGYTLTRAPGPAPAGDRPAQLDWFDRTDDLRSSQPWQ